MSLSGRTLSEPESCYVDVCVSSPHLGVKITGGYREITGEDFGVYIKRVVAGGLADQDGMYVPHTAGTCTMLISP